MLALTIFLQGATMYFNNLIKTKTLVRLRVDMGYKIIAYIIDVSQLGIVFYITESDHEDYLLNKITFISASVDCSFTVV
jgi:hypothetical protein